MTRTAIIAGLGMLPKALVQAMPAKSVVAALEGFLPDGLDVDVVFRVERLAPFLRSLEDQGIARVVFAGAVRRPRLDPAMFDPETAALVPRLMAAMQGGDDATLRAVMGIFEEAGFTVAGVGDVAPGLVPGAGVIAGQVSAADERDAERAALIVAALGAVDVGQGAVVQHGLCIAVEALPGTDAMLASVAALPDGLRPGGPGGVFFKAPKPGQDRRIDLPTLGPETVRAAARAGLGGIAWEAGGVICLDLPAMITAAQEAGLFLWSRAP
jgi:UDP-2,3-diacylglucosamine hydrolase